MDTATLDFFKALWDCGRYGYYYTLPNRRTRWMHANAPQAFEPKKNAHYYFGVHPVEVIPHCNAEGEVVDPSFVRGRIEHVQYVNCLFAEFDARETSKPILLERIGRLKILPSVIVDSGGGYHTYWLLTSTRHLVDASERELFSRLQFRFVDWIGGDTQSKDLARVLRIPGTQNWKYPDAPVVQFVQYDLTKRYSLTEISTLLPKVQPPSEKSSTILGTDYELPERLLLWALKNASRNRGGFNLAVQLRDNGYGKEEAAGILRRYVGLTERKPHPYTEREAMASVEQAYRRSPRAPLEAA